MTAQWRGKLLILAMFALALAAAMFAIWYLRGLSQRALDNWGPEVSDLIVRAPQVEAARLPDHQWRDISKAPGLINLRRALVADASYDWSPSSTPSGVWQYALRFHDRDREAVIMLSLESGQAMLQDHDRPISVRPILPGLEAFLRDHFPP